MSFPLIRSRRAGAVAVRTVLWLPLVGALSACSSLGERLPSITSVVTPYKIDVVQGNVVTREQMAAIRTGMPREAVRNVLGSPLLTSVFHADRWDYVFTFRRQGQPEQQRRVALFFKNDVLERFEADELPSEVEFVASLDVKKRSSGKPPVLQATDEQLKAFDARHNSRATPAPAAPAGPTPTPAASYPPLEGAPAGGAR